MKSLFAFLLIAATFSCSKDNESKSDQPLKAIPAAAAPGNFKITLNASASTGAITKYGWQLDISTTTSSAVTYAPNSSHEGSDFIPITATVTKIGTYTFGLTVYDKDNNKHYALVTVEVK